MMDMIVIGLIVAYLLMWPIMILWMAVGDDIDRAWIN